MTRRTQSDWCRCACVRDFSILRRSGLAALCAVALAGSLSSADAAGLPGEFVASNQWRNLFSFHSPLSNPAFMTEENYKALRGVLSFSPPPYEISQLWETGITLPVGLYQSLGFTWIAEKGLPLQDGEFTETGAFVELPGSVTNENDLYVGSYAINPWRQLSLGGNLKVLRQTGFGTPTTGVGADVGLSYRLLRHPLLGLYILGLNYQNVASLKFGGTEEGPDASQLKATYHSTHFENRFELDCQFDLTDFSAKPSDFLGKDGIQFTPKAEWRLAAQAGFWLMRFFNIKAYMGYGDDNTIQFWGLGAGINAPSLNTGRDFSVTYQFRDENTSGMAASHSIYVRADVGKHREEIYARKMARMLDLSANGLYNKALKLYYGGQYWDAYFIFSRIINGFPDFFKNDWVAYYQGACLEGLDMRKAGLEAYEYAESRNVAGETNPYSQLGRMRIYYRNDNLAAVQEVFGILSANTEAPDSLRHHASYLMGETYLRSGNFANAVQPLSTVPETHPDYPFAQHSLAIANILQNSDPQQAVEALEKSVGGMTGTQAQREIVARSYLLFGYLFYEEQSLAKAVTALRKIPAESFYYEDALVGLCWAAQKAGQWKDCIVNGQLLANKSTNPVLQSEGMLIEGFGHIMEKSYDQGRMAFEAALAGLKKHQDISEDEIERERNSYENTRISYDQLSEEMVSLAGKSELASRAKQTDSLHQAQGKTKEKIDAAIRFGDRTRRSLFFGKNASKLKEDLEYALVTVQTILKNRGSIKNVEKAKEEETQIDQEIEKLKKQLQESR